MNTKYKANTKPFDYISMEKIRMNENIELSLSRLLLAGDEFAQRKYGIRRARAKLKSIFLESEHNESRDWLHSAAAVM